MTSPGAIFVRERTFGTRMVLTIDGRRVKPLTRLLSNP